MPPRFSKVPDGMVPKIEKDIETSVSVYIDIEDKAQKAHKKLDQVRARGHSISIAKSP